MQLYVNPDRITTATGDTSIDVDTGLYASLHERLDDCIQDALKAIDENDGMSGFIFVGNDTYRPASLHEAHRQSQKVVNRRHIKRAYNSARQQDRRYRNVIC